MLIIQRRILEAVANNKVLVEGFELRARKEIGEP